MTQFKYILILFLILFPGIFAQGVAQSDGNTLSFRSRQCYPGETITCDIDLNNTQPLTAFQFQLSLPEGVTVVREPNTDGDMDYAITLTDRKTSSHTLSFNKQADGSFVILSFSTKNAAFSGNSGAIVQLKLKVSEAVQPQSLPVLLKEIILTAATGGVEFNPSAVTGNIQVNRIPDVNYMAINPQTVRAGDELDMPVSLINPDPVSAFQCRLVLPQGFEVVKAYNADNELDYAISLTSRKKSSHQIAFNKQADGSFIILAYSTQNAAFSGTEGALFQVRLRASAALSSADYTLKVSDITLDAPVAGVSYRPLDAVAAVTVQETTDKVTLTINPSLPDALNYSGQGVYASGTKVIMTAQAKPGYRFIGWESAGQLISRSEHYETLLNENQEWTARVVLLGDADGDMQIDVFDATHTVNHIIERESTVPFHFYAADVSPAFDVINVADVVGIVDLAFAQPPYIPVYPSKRSTSELVTENNKLIFRSQVPLAGFDFAYTGDLSSLLDHTGMMVSFYTKKGQKRVIAYALSEHLTGESVELFGINQLESVDDVLFIGPKGVEIPCRVEIIPTSAGKTEADDIVVFYKDRQLIVQGVDEVQSVALYNLSGTKIRETKALRIPVSDFPKGVYLVRIRIDASTVLTRKVVIL